MNQKAFETGYEYGLEKLGKAGPEAKSETPDEEE
jgi:hypothetical protein